MPRGAGEPRRPLSRTGAGLAPGRPLMVQVGGERLGAGKAGQGSSWGETGLNCCSREDVEEKREQRQRGQEGRAES